MITRARNNGGALQFIRGLLLGAKASRSQRRFAAIREEFGPVTRFMSWKIEIDPTWKLKNPRR